MNPHNTNILSSSSSSAATEAALFSLRLKFVFPAIQPQDPPTYGTSTTTSSSSSSSQKPTSNLHSVLTISLFTAITCLIFLVILFLFIRGSSRNRSFRDLLDHFVNRRGSSSIESEGHRRSGARGVDPSLIESLPEFAFEGFEKGSVDCAVCLCEFGSEDVVKKIPFCGHFFHPKCIEMWLLNHSSCPLCRSAQLFPLPVVTADESAKNRASLKEEEKLGNVVVDLGRPSSTCSD